MDETTAYSQNAEDYELGNAIGFGSSAIVYIATYRPLGSSVAIKMIELDRFERNQIDELRKEILVMSLCKHENLLQVLASFVNESKLWIVTPYMSLGSCLDLLKHYFKDGLEEKYIQVILYQALLGLHYLHKNGHIHRDVKAGNLLLQSDGLVRLADFGVTSSLMEDTQRRGSLRKTFVGTPCWMAPEVMEMTKGYNSKADIWSLGITALEMAYGSAPLSKYPPMKVIYMTLSNSSHLFLDRSRTKHKYGKSFKLMIDACLERDPIKRPTAEVLLKDPFFKSVRKHWISSHPEAVLIKDHMTKVTGGSLILKELISHLMDVHTRSTAAITAIPLAQPTVENTKNLTVNSNNEESEMDDSVSLSTQGENGSQSSWDFDEENSSKNTTQELQSIGHDLSENQPKEISTSEGNGLSEGLPIEAKQTSSFLVGEIPLSSGHTSEEQLSQSICSEVVRKGRFSVIDTVTPSPIVGPTTAATSTTGNSTVQGTPILSTISPNNILEESITSESKQPSSRPAVPESRRFPLTESRPSESRPTPVESRTTITESDESISRKPGMTLEKKGSRFKITNEQLVASLITSPSQLPALVEVLKMVKDLEKCIISLYEDNEALRKNLTALTTSHQHSHSDVSSPQTDIIIKKNSPSEAPIILPDSTTDSASKIMDHKKSVTFQEQSTL